ncbi:MAG: hypothetical protein AAF490_02405 [Chloroflexota bacterium]
METRLIDIQPCQLIVVQGHQEYKQDLLELTAVLALSSPVYVLDGGNCIDIFRVARHIRHRSASLFYEALNRVHISRAFMAYQLVALFQNAPQSPQPYLMLDLLATLADESITTAESYRLLGIIMQQLERLRSQAPIVISLNPPPQPERLGLVTLLAQTANKVITPEEKTPLRHPSLFQRIKSNQAK